MYYTINLLFWISLEMKKLFWLFAMFFVVGLGIFWFWFTDSYLLFYGQECGHCHEVLTYVDDNGISDVLDIKFSEVYHSPENAEILSVFVDKLGLDMNKIWVPFLLIKGDDSYSYKMWVGWIIDILDNAVQKVYQEESEYQEEVLLVEKPSLDVWNIEKENLDDVLLEEDLVINIDSEEEEYISQKEVRTIEDKNIENKSKYIFFYADRCSHCQLIENFLAENDVADQYDIEFVEVSSNRDNLPLFQEYLDKLGLDSKNTYVPLLVVDDDIICDFFEGSEAIAHYFAWEIWLEEVCLEGKCEAVQCDAEHSCDESFSCQASVLLEKEDKDSLWNRLKFFGIMLPAALADSINPCAFAVILLLLSAILSREENRKRAILAWLLFSLAVFISYFLMWLGLFSALSSASNVHFIKIFVVVLWILVWLANLKDYFWYWKGFVMEVPFGWRPKMQKLIKSIVSPIGAFLIWFVVSLFLLPCTSWPYITVLAYLASESQSLHFRGYIYLLVYNLIFVLPMFLITILVGFGFASAEKIAAVKNQHKKLIHLIVWLLMLWLVTYVLFTI